jgi:hypothetical protein
MEKPLVDQVESHVENEISTELEILPITKNSWLFPQDTIGKLQKGVVFNEQTYSPDVEVHADNTYTIYSTYIFK